MNKLYQILMCSLLLAPVAVFSQNRTNDNGTEQLPSTPGGVDYLGSCDTISTTFIGGNGADGNIFSVRAKKDIILQNFEGHIDNSGIVKIYYLLGPYAGFENNPGAWTLVDSAFVTSNGSNTATAIPIQLNMEIDSNEIVSFYITTNGAGGSVGYTDGVLEGALFSSNGDIEIFEGQGMTYPFGGNFTPRVWNGRINYCPNINYCDEITTTYAGGNGLDGVFFEVTSLQDAIIQRFDVSVEDTGYIYIYYKAGPYTGTTTNPGAWTLADSALVGTAGVNMPTEVPIDLDLYMPQGQLYSFLITGNGVDGQGVDYTNGTAIGAPYVTDNTLQVREGEGSNAPWLGGNSLPRVFNGTIHYCHPGMDTAVVCHDLFTTNAGGNGNDGIMFDVDAKQDAIEIQSFETYFGSAGPQEVRIYYKNNTHIGFESNDSLWTLIDSVLINVPAIGTLVSIPIPVGIQLAPFTKKAFFIYSTGAVDYTNGVGVTVPDTIFAQDNFMVFREGTGKSGIFTPGGNNPRVFNGEINYCYLESFIGIEENIPSDGILIWPNPTDGIFNISISKSAEDIQRVEIVNINGQVISQLSQSSGNTITMDISGQPAGLYFVRTYTNKSSYIHKIIHSSK